MFLCTIVLSTGTCCVLSAARRSILQQRVALSFHKVQGKCLVFYGFFNQADVKCPVGI